MPDPLVFLFLLWLISIATTASHLNNERIKREAKLNPALKHQKRSLVDFLSTYAVKGVIIMYCIVVCHLAPLQFVILFILMGTIIFCLLRFKPVKEVFAGNLDLLKALSLASGVMGLLISLHSINALPHG